MFSKKIQLEPRGKSVSVATALVLMAINELIEEDNNLDRVYGYQIMSHLKDAFNWSNVKSGTIYPILKKLDEEHLIRRVFGPDVKTKSKRQTIFYKITNKGKKLAEKIDSLNDKALDMALTSSTEDLQMQEDMHVNFKNFPEKQFTNGFLMPFLMEYDRLISKLITPDISTERIEELENEIKASMLELNDFENSLKTHLSKIKKIKSLNR